MCGLLDQGCRSPGFSTRPFLEGLEAFSFGKVAFFGLRGSLLLRRWLFAIGSSFVYALRAASPLACATRASRVRLRKYRYCSRYAVGLVCQNAVGGSILHKGIRS